MKKQIIILVVCLLFAAALGGALWFLIGYEPQGEASSAPSSTVKLIDKTSYDLDTLSVQNESGSYTIKNLGDSSYQVEEMKDAPLNNSLLSSAANAGVQLTATSVVTDKPENLADFGLDTPRASMTAKYTDGSTFTVLLGADAPGGNGIYGKKPDEDTVYLLSSYTFTNILKDPLEFADKTITTQPDANAQQNGSTVMPSKATFGGSCRPEPIVVVMDDKKTEEMKNFNINVYRMTAPKERAVDSGDATDAIAGLLSITADSVAAYNPSEDQLKEMGLSEPYSTVDFTYKDAQEKELSVLIALSQKDDEGNVYLQKKGLLFVYRIAASKLPWYEMGYGDFISSLQLLPYIDDLKTITLTSAQGNYAFTLEGEGDELKVTLGGEAVDTDKFRSFYQTIIGVPAEDFTDETPPDASQALLNVTFSYRDDTLSEDTIQFLPGPTRKVFLSINGVAEFYTKQAYVETILENAKNITTDAEVKPLY